MVMASQAAFRIDPHPAGNLVACSFADRLDVGLASPLRYLWVNMFKNLLRFPIRSGTR